MNEEVQNQNTGNAIATTNAPAPKAKADMSPSERHEAMANKVYPNQGKPAPVKPAAPVKVDAPAKTEVKTEEAPKPEASESTTPPPDLAATDDKKVSDDSKPKDDAAEGSKPADKETEAKEEKKDEPEAKKVVPEKYDLKLPEQSFVDPKHLDRIAAEAKKRGLSQEEAQAWVKRDHELVASQFQHQRRELERKAAGWRDEVKSDPDFGGSKYKETCEFATRALERWGSRELIERLNDSRFGDYPELVKMLARIERAHADDKFVVAKGTPSQKKSIAERMWPNQGKE